MRVAHSRSSLGSSLTVTVPSSITKPNGGAWSSTQAHARGSRRSALPLTDVALVVKTTSAPSRTNHTGTTWGLPSSRVVATLAVRVPSITNACHSSSLMRRIPQPYPALRAHRPQRHRRLVARSRGYAALALSRLDAVLGTGVAETSAADEQRAPERELGGSCSRVRSR